MILSLFPGQTSPIISWHFSFVLGLANGRARSHSGRLRLKANMLQLAAQLRSPVCSTELSDQRLKPNTPLYNSPLRCA